MIPADSSGDGARHEVAADMEELVEELDAHMAAEERTFLSPLILRADEIGGTAFR